MPTLKKQVEISGVGIHSGMPVNVVIKPSNKNGIFMRRVDLYGSDLIPARFDNVGETKMRNTTIGKMNAEHVQTIEHLMAAFFMMGIDGAIVEIDGAETPILDGSAAEFIDAIKSVDEFNSKIKRVIITKEEIDEAVKNAGKQISDSYNELINDISDFKGTTAIAQDEMKAFAKEAFCPTQPSS